MTGNELLHRLQELLGEERMLEVAFSDGKYNWDVIGLEVDYDTSRHIMEDEPWIRLF